MSEEQYPGFNWLGVEELPLAEFLDKEASVRFVIKALHPSGARCPECSAPCEGKTWHRLLTLAPVRCSSCGHKWNWRSGTPLAGSTLKPETAMALALGIGLGLDTDRLCRWTGLSPSSIRLWRRKIRTLELAREDSNDG